MQFPFDLTKAKTKVSDDLLEISLGSEYIACFGAAKNIATLESFSNLKSLWLSGVNEKHAQRIPTLASVKTLIIHDLRTSTLSLIERFPNLETLLIWGNTKVTKLTELPSLKRLRVLGLEHFPKVRNIDEISLLKGLKMLCLTGSVDTALKFDTLAPLAKLKELELLHITNLDVHDESLEFVKELAALRKLHVSNQFPTIEYAALKSQCSHVRCNLFVPYIQGGVKCNKCGALKVMVVGKRKPFVCPACNPDKLKKYEVEFETLVENTT